MGTLTSTRDFSVDWRLWILCVFAFAPALLDDVHEHVAALLGDLTSESCAWTVTNSPSFGVLNGGEERAAVDALHFGTINGDFAVMQTILVNGGKNFFASSSGTLTRTVSPLLSELMTRPAPRPLQHPRNDRWLSSASSARTTKAKPFVSTFRSNSPKKFFPPLTRIVCITAKSPLIVPKCKASTAARSSPPLRDTKDGEFVTVQAHDSDRQSRQARRLHARARRREALERRQRRQRIQRRQIDGKVPRRSQSSHEGVEALFSAGKDELDVSRRSPRPLRSRDTELVSVKDEENTVRVWLDSKNTAD